MRWRWAITELTADWPVQRLGRRRKRRVHLLLLVGGVLREGDQRGAITHCLGGEPVDRSQVGPDVGTRLQLPHRYPHNYSLPRPGGQTTSWQVSGGCLGRRLLRGRHLRWRGLEPAGDQGQDHHAQHQPGHPQRNGVAVQPGEQVGADDGADHRDHHVGHRVQLLAGPAPAHVVEHHRGFHQREGGEGTEVDERRRGGNVQEDRDQAHDAGDHQVRHRCVELLAQPAENGLGQNGVAAHRVEQAGGAGLRGEAGGELSHMRSSPAAPSAA